VESTLALYEAQLGSRGAWQDVLGAIDEVNATTDDSKTLADENAQAWISLGESVMGYASSSADAAVASAKANNVVVDDITEAGIRAKATMTAIEQALAVPDLAGPARKEIENLRDRLIEAQEAGDIDAVLKLTGAEETAGTLDETTKDRDTNIKLETRGGPAVKAYVDRLTAERLMRIRLESRNGPAVDAYVDRLTSGRTALIRVESRNGPAVDAYLDGLASQRRVAYIDVEQRGGTGVSPGGTGLAMRGAPLMGGAMGAGGQVTVQNLNVTVQSDASGHVTAQSAAAGGRAVVRELTEYTRRNGSGWLRNLNR
jgi:hypothetical protein